jgi:hypothetical protein
MAEEDGSLFLIAGSQPLRLPGDGTAETLASLPDQVSEVRTWSRGQGRTFSQRLGICLPEQHRVLHGATRAGGTFRWPFSSTGVLRLGVRPGEGPGELLFPISFAPGTEDRLYVLDAGNSRVAVFAYNGDYITHWGDSGSGPGQFSLGPGNTADDLAGSIAVDDQGFIYVADPGNQRIQRFAP